MSLRTLHDRARRLGLGAMYEGHWSRDGFRDLFDHRSPAWNTSGLVEKANDLRAMAVAGISVDELIANYCETLAAIGDPTDALNRLHATLQVYADMGYPIHATAERVEAEPARASGVVHGGAFRP
jgi:hypothetical protein